MDEETRILFESDLLSLAKARVREGRLAHRSGTGKAKNPFCGDEIAVDLDVVDGAMKTVGYEAKACSLCVASAEMLSAWVEQHGGSTEGFGCPRGGRERRSAGARRAGWI